MNFRRLVGLLLAVGAGVAVLVFWPREPANPEDEIRQLVSRAVQGGEQRDPGAITELLDDGFRGSGAVGKREVQQVLLGHFFQAKQIVVLNPSLDVQVTGPTQGHFTGTFLVGRDGAAPDGTSLEIEADLEKVDGEWRITRASWKH